MLKAVILIGGPQKGTRFRPLSLDIPKPLFPVAGLPLIQHHIEACVTIEALQEILLIGYYPVSQIQPFVNEMQQRYDVNIKYLQEYTALGTAGGIYHFRDQIRLGNPDAFFLMNGDICADFTLEALYVSHKSKGTKALVTIMGTEATKQQSLNYGCMVTNKDTDEITHYVEKPSSYVSALINCGVYCVSLDIFQVIGEAFHSKEQDYYKGNGNANKEAGYIQLEQEILAPLAATGKMFAYQVQSWWAQIKTACAAIYANKHYLELYKSKHPERLSQSITEVGESGDAKCNIISDVYIHPSASIHSTAVLGPNVSVGPDVTIGPGVRIRESIILGHATIENNSLILHSIIGHNCRVGRWARIEGTPSDPDPNKPFAKMENPALFNNEGRLNPSITILGCYVTVPSEMILLNSIVLPNKELNRSFKNEIIL
ncbi:PREDICTED: mannose-1-phosphate guanyltransferase alpha-A [Nicrophorus vespilloides]|uniref:Mannose-1-phosphate guanyltransferase alpha-A n=1 Tax=Nicrophorus vespilloides TaxID=110193 RepID=A0ABM1N4J6_NICVS|nr:PREDICTED: mannose-1-phosphate guanyltransferase alpha-A [Nicrophorus vespilloides]